MNKLLVLIFASFILIHPLLAEENIGARPASMGGAFIAVADDANAVFVNPAGTGGLRGRYAAISMMSGQGRDNTLIYGVEHTPDGSLGVGYIQADAYNQSLYLATGNTASVVRTLNQTLVLAVGKELNDDMVVPENMGRMMMGANIKLIKKTATTYAGNSYALGTLLTGEFSLVYRLSDWISYGANVSSKAADASEYFKSTNSETYKFRFGGAFHSPDKKIILCAETNSVGAEYKFNERFSFRGGKDGGNSTLGFGVAFNNLTLDYAYVDGISPVNYLTFSWAIE